MRNKLFFGGLRALGFVMLLSGCAMQHTVPLATATPKSFGKIRLYGTENVPFEYEEIASLAQTRGLAFSSKEECLNVFAESAEELGADAILNFRMELLPSTLGFLVVFARITPDRCYLSLSGTAVKIKRP